MRLPLRPLRLLVPALAVLPLFAAMVVPLGEGAGRDPNPVAGPDDTTYCRVELRSWIVLGRGRHLYLECDCPEPFEHLSGRVEFTTASLRRDYDPSAAAALLAADHAWAPRIARMSRAARLAPPRFIADPADRLEQAYLLPVSAVETLQRDRLFAAPYRLLGPNSNSAIRAVMEEAGVPLPARLRGAGGILSEFPGLAQSPGTLLPADQWASSALPGPTPIPGTHH